MTVYFEGSQHIILDADGEMEAFYLAVHQTNFQITKKLNPLDLDQWEFYVIPTSLLDREPGDIQSISLARVKQYSADYTFKQLEQLYDQLV